MILTDSFNKIFNLKFYNYSELIAKIPYPLLIPRHLCTASEVATIDYERTLLGLPVPKVFGWSASAERTDVGAEYILMEKVSKSIGVIRISEGFERGDRFVIC